MYPASSGVTPDIHVHLGTPAPWGANPVAEQGAIYRAPAKDPDPPVVEAAWLDGHPGIRLRYADGVAFYVQVDGRQIWATWPSPYTIEDAATYLFGPILGYVLRRLGVLALHASGVVIEGRVAAFCGWGGAGKSTIAATFAAAGYPALSDDVLALRQGDGVTLAFPAGDHLRVWDDSAALLVGEASRLPLLTPNWDKRAVPLSILGYAAARVPAPLRHIFLLDERVTDDAAPRLERLRPADALLRLVGNSSANYLLDEHMRAAEFQQLSRLVADTPVSRLIPHADPARLPLLVSRVTAAMAGA